MSVAESPSSGMGGGGSGLKNETGLKVQIFVSTLFLIGSYAQKIDSVILKRESELFLQNTES